MIDDNARSYRILISQFGRRWRGARVYDRREALLCFCKQRSICHPFTVCVEAVQRGDICEARFTLHA